MRGAGREIWISAEGPLIIFFFKTPTPSIWPVTRCPPRGLDKVSDLSRFTGLPAPNSPRVVSRSVSSVISAVNEPASLAVTVRQTPSMDMLSPRLTSSRLNRASTPILPKAPLFSINFTAPTDSTMPVNISFILFYIPLNEDVPVDIRNLNTLERRGVFQALQPKQGYRRDCVAS